MPREVDPSLIPAPPDAPLKVGISRCLTGREVRYDGTGARSSMPHAELEGLFEFSDVCPEVGIGMTVPRAPIRLIEREGRVRVVGVKDPEMDKTDALYEFGVRHAERSSDLCGFVFMHSSPSCGLYRVKLYPRPDVPAERRGRGMFAQAMTDALPDVPMEDAGRLFDEVLRENFVTRVFAYGHWRRCREALTPQTLILFHSMYKYLLMAHDQITYKACGRLLSNLKQDFERTADAYVSLLMKGLSKPATRSSHANVLSHLQGYLKRDIDGASRQELVGLIDAYRRGEVPLLAPLALLKHHFRETPDEYVLMQTYLQPHPQSAGLRRSL